MTLREKGKNKNNLKVLFYSKVFFNLCFTFSAFITPTFFLLPFSILHFFLSVCLSVCAIFVLLFICVFKSVSACTHNISHSFHLFSWMNEWLFHLCVCSFCVFVHSVWLFFLSVGEKGWINLFSINNWFLIVSVWANLIICLFVSLFE